LQGADGRLYATTPGFRMRVPDDKGRALERYIGQNVTLGVRPEHLVERSRMNGGASDSAIPVTVDIVEQLGNEIFVYLTNNGTTLTARMDPDLRLHRGQQIEVAAEPHKLHFFDNRSEEKIG
jgi:multiple sugar transport system ATP-binding protein